MDFGSVYKDIKYEKNVVVTNNTTSALSITKVVNTAELMINTEYPTSAIEPGESVNIKGLYPIGEGAGYAGGIISAAIDGVKTVDLIFIEK